MIFDDFWKIFALLSGDIGFSCQSGYSQLESALSDESRPKKIVDAKNQKTKKYATAQLLIIR